MKSISTKIQEGKYKKKVTRAYLKQIKANKATKCELCTYLIK
jgi:hypothetical protein